MPDYSKYQFLKVEVADHIATLTLNRPDHLNAINTDMHEELERIWLDLAQDEAARAIVLTGAGKTFSAGGDLKRMAAWAGTRNNVRHGLHSPGRTRRLWQNLLEVPQPIVAAINGDALGLGATLALFSDITVMSDTARIGDTHVRVGLVAGDGGAVIWPMLVGMGRAKDFLLRGASSAAPRPLRSTSCPRVSTGGRRR